MTTPRAEAKFAAPAGPSRAPGRAAWLLVPVVALAALLRIRLALGSPLWFEEVYVLLVSRRSAAGAWWTAAHDIHPPLPFLLRHLWTRLGGDGAPWQKTLSITLALAAFPVAFRLFRRLFGTSAALVATALMAVSFALVRYGQEVGMFSLQWLLALLLVDAWSSWIESGRRRDAALGVAVAVVALYTHYAFLAVEVVLAAWGALALRRQPGRRATWAALHALALAAFLPQAPTFLQQLAREGTLRYASFPAPQAVLEYGRTLALHHRLLLPLFAALAAVPFFDRSRRLAASLMALLVVLPPIAIRIEPLTFPTEFLFAAPFAFALVAAGLDARPLRGLRLSLAALVVAYSAWWCVRQPPFHEGFALRESLGVLRSLRAPGDLVVHAETHSLLFALYYDPGGRNRLLIEDSGTQYFDGGLAIPDSARMTAAEWGAARARGERWWGMAVDRARVTRDQVTRAGAAGRTVIEGAARGRRWVMPPVTLWEGLPERRP